MEGWNERVRKSFTLEYTSDSSHNRVNLLEILLNFPCPFWQDDSNNLELLIESHIPP